MTQFWGIVCRNAPIPSGQSCAQPIWHCTEQLLFPLLKLSFPPLPVQVTEQETET